MLALVTTIAAFAAPAALGATFTVSNEASRGDGSFRAAVDAANLAPGHDEIVFTAGAKRVKPFLAKVTDPVTIDATEHEGGVVFDGQGSYETGLVIAGGGAGSVIRGLTFVNWLARGIEVSGVADAETPTRIEHCIIGRDGGGNTYGLLLTGRGIRVGPGNVIAGNVFAGVSVFDFGSDDIVIAGNLFGLDPTGASSVPSGEDGISIAQSRPAPGSVTIGGDTPAAANTIASSRIGIFVAGQAGAVRVAGNRIGTDVTGMLSRPNEFGILHAGSSTEIADNLISGNSNEGIRVQMSDVSHLTMTGNVIGLAADGTTRLPNGKGVVGVDFDADPQTTLTIGGPAPGEGNVISGNHDDGLYLSNPRAVLKGNRIGTSVDATSIVPNGSDGLVVVTGPTTIGGTEPGAGNVIRGNLARGVAVRGGSGHRIRGNAISGNFGLGIDLGADWVSADGGPDRGPNGYQRPPVVTFAESEAGATTIRGTVTGPAESDVEIDLFASATCDPTGYGEGENYLATVTAAVAADGRGAFERVIPTALDGGTSLTATVTTADGNTSEFSACRAVVAIPPPPPPPPPPPDPDPGPVDPDPGPGPIDPVPGPIDPPPGPLDPGPGPLEPGDQGRCPAVRIDAAVQRAHAGAGPTRRRSVLRVKVRIGSGGPVTVNAALRKARGGAVLARATPRRVADGTAATLRLPLTARGQRMLRPGTGRLWLAVRARSVDPACAARARVERRVPLAVARAVP